MISTFISPLVIKISLVLTLFILLVAYIWTVIDM